MQSRGLKLPLLLQCEESMDSKFREAFEKEAATPISRRLQRLKERRTPTPEDRRIYGPSRWEKEAAFFPNGNHKVIKVTPIEEWVAMMQKRCPGAVKTNRDIKVFKKTPKKNS